MSDIKTVTIAPPAALGPVGAQLWNGFAAAQNFLRVDGTPKVEKEKATVRSFVKRRSWPGLIGDAFRLARAWR